VGVGVVLVEGLWVGLGMRAEVGVDLDKALFSFLASAAAIMSWWHDLQPVPRPEAAGSFHVMHA
jgi:hypothetical protein